MKEAFPLGIYSDHVSSDHYTSHEMKIEYRGETLSNALQTIPPDQISRTLYLWATQTASAFAVMHSKKIFHTKISPSHIVWHNGQNSIINFSAAVQVNDPPEQARDANSHSSSHEQGATMSNAASLEKSDIYDWGMAMYQLAFPSSDTHAREPPAIMPTDTSENTSLQNKIKTKDFPGLEDIEKHALRQAIWSAQRSAVYWG